MSQWNLRAARALAVAGAAAGLMSAVIWVPSAAAEKAPTSAQPAGGEPAQAMAAHLQAHLDELAGRLQIKASQEPAWQAFSAAYRDLITALVAQRKKAAMAGATELDAAALARQRADWAADRAQKLARLADATAKLQQSLDADQRLVLNEVARHFASEHFEHGPMHGRFGPHGSHCEGGDEGHGPGEHHPMMPYGDGPEGGAPSDGAQGPGGPSR